MSQNKDWLVKFKWDNEDEIQDMIIFGFATAKDAAKDAMFHLEGTGGYKILSVVEYSDSNDDLE